MRDKDGSIEKTGPGEPVLRRFRIEKRKRTFRPHGELLANLAAGTVFGLMTLCPLMGQTASPLAVHTELREAVLNGEDVSGRVRKWIESTGDSSFDSFLRRSETLEAALRLQIRALSYWDGADHTRALKTYEEAAELLLLSGAWSEAAFCLYYAAEILAEQEQLVKSLRFLEESLGLAATGSRSRIYLEALILQSKGYCLWFLDYLRPAIEAFGLAQERWQRLSLAEGMVTSWNNLAVIYEELRLARRARSCYETALKAASQYIDPEIRFQLHANAARFLHEQGFRDDALLELEKARALRHVSDFEFLLLEVRLGEARSQLEELRHRDPDSLSNRIERALLLAQHATEAEESERYFSEALRLSHPSHRYLRRQAAVEMGTWLESRGRFRDAARVYREIFSELQMEEVPEYIFPYSRAVSPLYNGWIRCLIRLGSPEEAWKHIQEWAEQRTRRALRFMRAPPQPRAVSDALSRFAEAVRLEIVPLSPQSHSELSGPSPSYFVSRNTFNIVEMWPDKHQIYAWVTNSRGRYFRILRLAKALSEALSDVVSPFYAAEVRLPVAPSGLRRLHKELFEPLEDLLDSSSILFVGHKELQVLPMEMLLDGGGNLLLSRYFFSYLPSSNRPVPAVEAVGPPILILPNASGNAGIPAAGEEQFFRNLFPELEILRNFEISPARAARWIHVSTHFNLKKEFWLQSDFNSLDGDVPLASFLSRPVTCSLLSLGVCDAGNSFSWGSPYWLGISELLLTQRVRAMLVSRWKLDEYSSTIYMAFFRLCRQGIPMDQALTLARREFLGKSLQRAGHTVSSNHPFFWAGISYIGIPGERLYEEQAAGSAPLPSSFLLVAAAGLLVWALIRSRLATH